MTDDLRQPENHAEELRADADIRDEQHPDPPIGQHLIAAADLERADIAPLLRLGGDELVALALVEPSGTARIVGQQPADEEREYDCRQGFENEHPLPRLEPEPGGHLEQRARERAADDDGERGGGIERANGAAALALREP